MSMMRGLSEGRRFLRLVLIHFRLLDQIHWFEED